MSALFPFPHWNRSKGSIISAPKTPWAISLGLYLIPMKRLQFSVTINASPEIVYDQLTDPKAFAQWSVVFDPNSHLEGSWEKGSLVRLLTYNQAGDLCGLLSNVRENIPNRKIHLDHMGVLEKGVEIFQGPEVEQLKGASEIYHIIPQGKQTRLAIESDAIMDLESYLIETWPLALEKLKEQCEKLNS